MNISSKTCFEKKKTTRTKKLNHIINNDHHLPTNFKDHVAGAKTCI